MKTIKINEQFANEDELANTLVIIADLIKQGYTVGYYPAWELIEILNDETNENQD